MGETILLPGDDEKPDGEASDPTIILTEGFRTIEATTLGDEHASALSIRRDLDKNMEDWGDGFYVHPGRVLITRNPDGGIRSVTDLNDLPGVHFQRGQIIKDDETQADVESKIKEVEGKPSPHPMSRAQRSKCTMILANRLDNYWKARGPNDPKYNPFRDGIQELPAGSPQHLRPLPGSSLYPATDGQIMAFAQKFVHDRTSIIDRRRFGVGQLRDLAIRIE